MRLRSAPLLLQFLATALVWGSSFLLMKVGLQGLSPGQVASWRIWLGAIALALMCLVTGSRLPRSARAWGLSR